MDAGQFRITPQYRPNPVLLQHERQPQLLTFGQPQRVRERLAASHAVAAVVAKPGVSQTRLHAHPFGLPAPGR